MTHATRQLGGQVIDKRVYFFGNGQADGNAEQRSLLGGKGANLAEMTNMRLPVPPGFTIVTTVCRDYQEDGGRLPTSLYEEINQAVARLESLLNLKFGSVDDSLLVSVRSGAPISMPGMMDTILNIGLNDEVVEGLANKTGDRRFAYDSYRRLIAMYGEVVLELDNAEDNSSPFEHAIDTAKREANVSLDSELSEEQLLELTNVYKQIVEQGSGKPFPQDPRDQLYGAISAVFRSWNNTRAVSYRKINNISSDLGTAVNVQTMVFGNLGDSSGTGVAFSRDPSTGEARFFGEYLMNAQGEDVVAGIRTPLPLNGDAQDTLQTRMPDVYQRLNELRQTLETHYQDMQDIEFTIQQGKLFLLQTRTGKRTAAAAVRIAVEMVHEGLIGKKEAVRRVLPAHVDQLLHPMLDPTAARTLFAKGLPASPGAATGTIVLTSSEAEERGKRGEKVILVRTDTSPEDVSGMHHAEGVLTARGGMTSHAAVVARTMGRPCVVGCSELTVDVQSGTLMANTITLQAGDTITIDGASGEVIVGEVATVQASGTHNFEELMSWADEFRRLRVRTNADTPEDAAMARTFGAEGVGLCRTEHMFFAPERIGPMREMILADSEGGRRAALAVLAPMQREDFKKIFETMAGFPVTIRLLDPPLHEFLPRDRSEVEVVARSMGRSAEAIRLKVEALREHNPMLGLRGCRLGLKFPEIYEMQVQAVLEAAVEAKRSGLQVSPEIMVPLVMSAVELEKVKATIDQVAQQVFTRMEASVGYMVGTMIEVPRAALTADQIALYAQFFSFGTNDLTQLTLGISRDDAGSFLPQYVEDGVIDSEPFQVIDLEGVGRLIEIAASQGRQTNATLKLGICGEHGGEPFSVAFSHRAGLDYVSCSPFRVPVARLAAAHAALQGQE